MSRSAELRKDPVNGWSQDRAQQDPPQADLVRQVVLPAGHLEVMISNHLQEEGLRLDHSTRWLLALARDGLRDIGSNGVSLATRFSRG